jgi:hypothetical protein
MMRAHAYALDPLMAKNLLAYVLKWGINNSTDILLRADVFHITHQGLYAYDKHFPDVNPDTTIVTRASDVQHLGYNSNLEW